MQSHCSVKGDVLLAGKKTRHCPAGQEAQRRRLDDERERERERETERVRDRTCERERVSERERERERESVGGGTLDKVKCKFMLKRWRRSRDSTR